MTYRTRNMPKRTPSSPVREKRRSGPAPGSAPRGSVEVEMVEETPLPGQNKIRTARNGGVMSSKMKDRMGRALKKKAAAGRAMKKYSNGGGVYRKAADGIATRGKTRGTEIKMRMGGMC